MARPPTSVQDVEWAEWIKHFPILQQQTTAALAIFHDDIRHHIDHAPAARLLDRVEARALAEDLMLLYEEVRASQTSDADSALLDLAVAAVGLVGGLLIPTAESALAAFPLAVATWSVTRRRTIQRRNKLIDSILSIIRDLSRTLRR